MNLTMRWGDLNALNAITCKPIRGGEVFRTENIADPRDFRSACNKPFSQQGPFYALVHYDSQLAWWRAERFIEAEEIFELDSQNRSGVTVGLSEIFDTAYVDNGFLVGGKSFRRSFTSLASRRAKMDIEDSAPFFITPVNYNFSAIDHSFMQLLGYGDAIMLERYADSALPDFVSVAQRPPLTRKLVDQTPLNYAVSVGSKASTSWLLGRGCNPNVTDHWGISSVFTAAAIGDVTIIDLLANHGANLEIADDRGLTPLHIAVCNNNTEAALLLLKKGVSARVKDENGETPLHCIREENAEIIDALLACGADIDAQDFNGQTPLHLAVENGFTLASKHLVRFGAALEVKDDNGETPLELMDVHMKKEIFGNP